MADVAGLLFAIYALYRALIGRPLKGKKRPISYSDFIAQITVEIIRAEAITAPEIRANVITAEKLHRATA